MRTESQIHAGATSVGSVAVELAEQIFGDLSGTRVLILGAGEMSRVTGRARMPGVLRAFMWPTAPLTVR